MTSLIFGNFYFDCYTYRFGLGLRLGFGLELGLGLRLGLRVSFFWALFQNVCTNGTFTKPLPLDSLSQIVENFNNYLEGFISPEIFIYFFVNSDSNLTQTQMLTLKLFPNRTLTQTLT